MAKNSSRRNTGWTGEPPRTHQQPDIDKAQPSVGKDQRREVDFQAVLENIADGFLALDRDYRCTYVNKAATAALETTADKLVGRPIWDAFPPARYPQLHKEISRAVEQKVVVKFAEYCEPCGHWYEWHCCPTDDGLAIFIEDASERKGAEEQVVRSAQQHRLLFETMPQGVVYQDAEGKIISMNPAAERILGRAPPDFLGRTSVDEEHHTLREDGTPFPGLEHPSMVALRTGQEVRDVVMGVLNPQAQAYRWINITAVPLIRPGEDKPYQVYTHFSDITELKQARCALRDSERRFRKLFEADPMGVFITKPDGTFLDCNEAMVKMLGYGSREEILRHRSTELYVDPEFRREVIRILQKEGVYLGKEGRVWRKDGSIAHLLGAAVLLTDEETGEPYVQGVAVDITERKQAEEALRASEQRYRKLFEANLAGVYLAKLDGTILDFNDAMMKMLGYDSREEVFQHRVMDFYVDPEVRLELIRLLRKNGLVEGQEVLLRKKDGSDLYALGSAVLLADGRTGEPYIQGVALDVTDRRKTEEALRERERALREIEQRLRGVLENSLDAAYRRDLQNDRYEYLSPVVEQMIGFSSQEMNEFTKEQVLARVHPEDVERVRHESLEAEKAGMGTIEYRFQCKDGTYRWLADYFVVQKDHEGRPRYYSGSIRNISGLKQAEEALRASEQRFRKLFEANLAGVYITKLDGTILDFNDTMMKMLGYDSREEVFQHHSSEFYADPEFRKELIRLLQKDGIVPGKEALLQRKDGSTLYALGAGVLMLDERTGERYIQGVAVDITERKQAEQRLAKNLSDLERLSLSATHYLESMSSSALFQYTAQQLHAVAGNAIVAVSEYDPRTNQATVRVVAGPEEKLRTLSALLGRDAVGMTFAVAESTRAQMARGRLERLESGLYNLTLHQVPRSVSTLIEQELSVGDIYVMPFYLGEDLMGTVAVVTDRAEGLRDPELLEAIVNHAALALKRTRTEEALRESEQSLLDLTTTLESRVAQRTAQLEHRARQLQKLTLDLSEAEDQERRRLAEILHDDLQQVLAGAKFHLGLMRSRVQQDPPLQALAAQIEQMLKDAIAKSRSLSHELSPVIMRHEDFAETLQWLGNQVQAKHGLTVHVHAHGKVQLQSDALRAFLYRTAQELLFNAAKHAQVNRVTVQVRRLGRWIYLSVRDRGRGFDPQELQEAAGFGLLSIHERIELLGGRMKIRSAKDKGSTFSIVVPDGEAVKDEASGARDERRTPAPRPSGPAPLRVLLADDHEIVRQGLSSLLGEEHSLEVVGEAANGREAVDLADQLRPDVVIMDVSMPIMSGEEATRQIKRDLPQIRIISLSMWEEPEIRERMYRAGAEGYVLKTAPSEELLAAIRGKEAES